MQKTQQGQGFPLLRFAQTFESRIRAGNDLQLGEIKDLQEQMATKRKQSGFPQEFQNQLLALTADSPFHLTGTVLTRQRISGKSQKGDRELLKVEVRGLEGRIQSVIINDLAGIPPVGDFICLPPLLAPLDSLE